MEVVQSITDQLRVQREFTSRLHYDLSAED